MRRGAVVLLMCLLASTFPASAAQGMRNVGVVRLSDKALGRVEVHGDVAAVLQREEGIVALVDVSDERRPKALGRYDDGATQSLDGDLAFSTDGRFVVYARQTVQFSRDGIHVIDVADPKNPTLRSYSAGGGAYRVLFHSDASGDYVVLLDAVLGLVVYRFVEGVLIPVHVDALPATKVGGPASAGMVIREGMLYVTTGMTGLQVYDFSDPLSPQLLGSWDGQGLAEVEVVAQGKKTIAYAASEYWFEPTTKPDIVVLDVTDPASIEEVDRWRVVRGSAAASDPLRVQGMTMRGETLYVANSALGPRGFRNGRSVDGYPSPPCGPTPPGAECGPPPPPPFAIDVEMASGHLYLTSADGFLRTLGF